MLVLVVVVSYVVVRLPDEDQLRSQVRDQLTGTHVQQKSEVLQVLVSRYSRSVADMHARRDRTLAAVGARGGRGNRRSRDSSEAKIEPTWDNQLGEMQKSPAVLVEASGSRDERLLHVSSTHERGRSGHGNAAIPARGLATSRREGAAFVTARGGNEFNTAREGNESELETARDTARDTARGFETDYMSMAEPDTGRSLSTALEVSIYVYGGRDANARWVY